MARTARKTGRTVKGARAKRRPTGLAAVKAVLEKRWMTMHPGGGCHCAACKAKQAEPFLCPFCGYAGPPVTMPCSCEETRQTSIERLKSHFTPTPENLVRLKELSAVRYARCPGESEYCNHTGTCCPTCADFGDGDVAEREAARPLVALIRELRRVVYSTKGVS